MKYIPPTKQTPNSKSTHQQVFAIFRRKKKKDFPIVSINNIPVYSNIVSVNRFVVFLLETSWMKLN